MYVLSPMDTPTVNEHGSRQITNLLYGSRLEGCVDRKPATPYFIHVLTLHNDKASFWSFSVQCGVWT